MGVETENPVEKELRGGAIRAHKPWSLHRALGIHCPSVGLT